MAIITISSDAFSRGEEIAEKIVNRLGYRSISRDVIYEASQKFRVPEPKLNRALHDAPSFYERFTNERRKYIAYVTAVILARFKDDNSVYHGLAGHFFADNIAHLLKVRVTARLDTRISVLMETENLSRDQAKKFLNREDRTRSGWSRHFYGTDNKDATLYDLVIRINDLNIDHGVEMICDMAAHPKFKTTPQSRQAMDDLALAAKIKAELVDAYPIYKVVAKGKSAEIYVRFSLHSDTRTTDKIKEKVLRIPGVSSVSVILVPSVVFT